MPTPDPTCFVNGGPPPTDVAAGATVTGGLQSTAGARFFSLECVDTDETSDAATVDASISINQTTKTFSFTMTPGLGSAAKFVSQVGVNGLGLDINGVYQPSYSTTFKVNVKAANGLRVLCTDELTEQNSAAGWVAVVNAAIRLASGGGVTPSGLGLIRFTFTTAATKASAADIPASYQGLSIVVTITTPYTAGTTLQVGQTGAPGAFIASGVIDPTLAFPAGVTKLSYTFPLDVAASASGIPLLVTLGGSPIAGAGSVAFTYGQVQA
jgi:hypothetical protein